MVLNKKIQKGARTPSKNPAHGLLGLGLLQDEFFLSGEYQYVLGWKQKLEEEGIQADCFSPLGEGVRGEGFKKSRRGESPLRKLIEIIPFLFPCSAVFSLWSVGGDSPLPPFGLISFG
jgi:hypothetical protein